VIKGQLPQRAGLPSLNGGGAAAMVPPPVSDCDHGVCNIGSVMQFTDDIVYHNICSVDGSRNFHDINNISTNLVTRSEHSNSKAFGCQSRHNCY